MVNIVVGLTASQTDAGLLGFSANNNHLKGLQGLVFSKREKMQWAAFVQWKILALVDVRGQRSDWAGRSETVGRQHQLKSPLVATKVCRKAPLNTLI